MWEGFGEFQPSDVHKQYGIAFRTPRYHNLEVKSGSQSIYSLHFAFNGNLWTLQVMLSRVNLTITCIQTLFRSTSPSRFASSCAVPQTARCPNHGTLSSFHWIPAAISGRQRDSKRIIIYSIGIKISFIAMEQWNINICSLNSILSADQRAATGSTATAVVAASAEELKRKASYCLTKF